MTPRFFNRLAVRQTALIIAAGLVLGFSLAFWQLRADLLENRRSFEHTVDVLLETAAKSAGLAAYELDAAHAQEVVNAIIELPGMVAAVVIDDFGRTLAQARRENSQTRSRIHELLARRTEVTVPLNYAPAKKTVGSLTAHVDEAPIVTQFLSRARWVIAMAMSTTLGIAVFVLLLFHFGFTRPMLAVTRRLAELDPETAGARISVPSGHANDELGSLVGSLNELLESLQVTIRRQREAREALLNSESRLAQAQKMEAIGRLAGGVAHDFNNLLTAMLGYTQLIIEDAADDTTIRKNAVEIKAAAERAGSLTHQLLAYSRKQVLQPRLVAVNSLIGEIHDMLRRLIGEEIEIAVELSAAPDAIMMDPVQLQQVVINLAVNARDAMQGGGRLLIRTRTVQSEADLDEVIRKTVSLNGSEYVELAVCDTGHGISEDVREHVFDPFYTTKEVGKGTGLGLASVAGIVAQSDGQIALDSCEGRGTTFYLYFPIEHSSSSKATSPG